MRKRIVTGWVMIGLAAFFVSQPRKGTVAWHKRKCLEAWYGQQRLEIARAKVSGFLGFPINAQSRLERENSDVLAHTRALVKLGHLETRTFFVNGDPLNAMSYAASAWLWPAKSSVYARSLSTNAIAIVIEHGEDIEVVKLQVASPNSVTVSAADSDLSRWEQIMASVNVRY